MSDNKYRVEKFVENSNHLKQDGHIIFKTDNDDTIKLELHEELDISRLEVFLYTVYRSKYHNDLVPKSSWYCHSYRQLADWFEKGLELNYNNVVEIIKNFNNCTPDMQVELIFAIIDLYNRKKVFFADKKMKQVIYNLKEGLQNNIGWE